MGDSCIGYEESMATQRQIGSKHPSRDANLIGLIQAIDPVANGQHLMKSIDPWAGAGGPDPRCCGHILRIFLMENNSINPKIAGTLELRKNTPELFYNYIFSSCNFTFRSLFNFL
jgi:hypothetical protein